MRIPGPATVTRFGAVIVNAAMVLTTPPTHPHPTLAPPPPTPRAARQAPPSPSRVALDPDALGACDKLRTPEDLSPRGVPPSDAAARAPTVLLLSQPWGHAAFHFIAECLPKLALAPPALLADPAARIHVPLSTDAPASVERAMVEVRACPPRGLRPAGRARRARPPDRCRTRSLHAPRPARRSTWLCWASRPSGSSPARCSRARSGLCRRRAAP